MLHTVQQQTTAYDISSLIINIVWNKRQFKEYKKNKAQNTPAVREGLKKVITLLAVLLAMPAVLHGILAVPCTMPQVGCPAQAHALSLYCTVSTNERTCFTK